MKQILRKKWARILLRVAVGGISMLVLAWLSFNWWAARDKARALAEARAAGLPLTLEEFAAGMPPDEQNAARTGLFREWEDAYENKTNWDAPPPGSPEESYRLLTDELYKTASQRDREKGGKWLDFTKLPKGGPLGQSAESFLAEYERRNRKTIDELQAGFAMPHMRRPLVPEGFAGDADEWVRLSEALGLRSRYAYDGLEVRAEAALMTGDLGTAAESIELAVRLAEWVGSRQIMVSVMIEAVGMRCMIRPLRSGVEAHLWRQEDLERIERSLKRPQIREQARRAIQTEVLMMHLWQGWKDDRSRLKEQGFWDLKRPGFTAWLVDNATRQAPDGWFDVNATKIVRGTLQCLAVLDGPGPASVWWQEGQRMAQDEQDRASWNRVFPGFAPGAHMLTMAARWVVERQLMLTACALERHYLTHGRYPDALDALPAEARIDPLHGTPFCYRVTDGKFALYSSGPDGKDDGGIKQPKTAFTAQADWIW